MRKTMVHVCRLVVVAVVLYGVFQPDLGLMFRGIGMTLALGLVGLGLCLDAWQAARAKNL